MGVSLSDALQALQLLEGSFVRLVAVGDQRWWQFVHPTLTDAYEQWLKDQPEMLAEYLHSTALSDLARTVTCGDRGIQGALVVPRAMFGAVIDRVLSEPRSDRENYWYWRQTVFPFLAERCSEAFLEQVVRESRDLVDEVFNVGAYLTSQTANCQLARRILDLGLADDDDRRALVDLLIKCAADGSDGSFLGSAAWMSFFSPQDEARLDVAVLERLDQLEGAVREDLSYNHDSWDVLDESLQGYEARYPISDHIAEARSHLRAHAEREPDEDDASWQEDGESASAAEAPARPPGRSVFDDLSL